MRSGRTTFLWGMLAGASLVALALAGTASRASAQAAPAKAAVTEPVRKVILDNARVHVKDVTFAPGASPMHTHALPHVGIILTAGTLVFTEPGKPADSVKFDVGSADGSHISSPPHCGLRPPWRSCWCSASQGSVRSSRQVPSSTPRLAVLRRRRRP